MPLNALWWRRRVHLLAHALGLRRGSVPRGEREAPPRWDDVLRACRRLDPRAVHVVASGPSARGFEPCETTLVVTCNDAWRLCRGAPFVYAIADAYIVRRYIAFGLPISPLATLFWAGENGPPATTRTAEAFAAYSARHRRGWPEVMAFSPTFEAPNPGVVAAAVDNATALAVAFEDRLSVEPKLMNSGMLALHVGWILALQLGCLPLHVHGLDLGYGPGEYFDGRRLDPQQHSIVGDRPRDRTATILRAMALEPSIPFHNHSFFCPDETDATSR